MEPQYLGFFILALLCLFTIISGAYSIKQKRKNNGK